MKQKIKAIVHRALCIVHQSKTSHRASCIVHRASCIRSLTLLLVMLMSVNVWGETYTITFKDSGTSSDGSANKTAKTDLVSDGGDFISSLTTTDKLYQAKSGYGIKIGSSNDKGTLAFSWNTTDYAVKPTKVSFSIKPSDANKTVLLSVNGGTATEITPTGDFTDYDVEMDDNTDLTSISVAAKNSSKNRFYLKSITVTYSAADPTEPSLSVSPTTIDFGTVEQNAAIPAGQDVEVTFANLTKNDVTASISGDFNISKSGSFTSGDAITVTPKSTATLGTIEGTLTVKATTDDITKTVPVTMFVAAPEVGVSFEKATSAYTDWDFTNFASQQTHSDVKAHTGAYFGTTDGKASGSMVTKAKIAKPGTLQFFISKQSTNTKSSSWKVSVSSDNSNWTQVGDAIDATSMSKGTWTEVNADLKSYSNVYVKIEYSGSTATRCIDDVVFIAPQSYNVSLSTNPASVGTVTAKVNNVEIGAQVEEGQTVTLSAAPNDAHAYRFKEWSSSDVEIEDNAFKMPGKAVSITAVFEPVYAVSVTTAGEGSGTATINGGTEIIYVGEDDEITLVAEATAGSEFGGWSATEGIVIFGDETKIAKASAGGTITATFNKKQCTILGTPQNIQVTGKTYSGAKLTWAAATNADYYEVYIKKGADDVENDMVEGTEYTISSALSANTEYSYSIIANSEDEDTYCASNPAEGNFTTADYPAVVLTLSENGSTSTKDGKLNTPIELPTTSTQACDGKVFMGWSANEIDGEAATATLLDATYTFTEPSVLEKTIYAVYATVVSEGQDSYQKATSLSAGDEVIWASEDNSKPNEGVTGYNGTKDATVSTTASDWMIFTVEAGSAQGTFKFKNGTNYIAAASSSFKVTTTTASDFTLNESSQAIWTSGSDKYALMKNGEYYRCYKTSNTSYTKFYVWKIVSGEKTYGNYCTTCQAAVAAPTFSLEGGNYNVAQTLTLTAAEGDIYYTINDGTETKYTAAIELDNRGTFEISAYAKVGDRTSETVTKTYTLNWPYTSLAELVAADIPSGTEVTISFEDAVIKSLATGYSIKGVYFDVQKEDKDIEIYCSSATIPENWKAGGTLSVTNLTCAWVRYSATGNLTCWELTPSNWNSFTYNDPVHITSIAISGEPTNKDYSAGQQLNPAGLVVTGYYSDHTVGAPHTEVITEGLTWTLPTLEEGATTAQVSVKYTEPVLSNELTSDPYQVTINAVTPAKTLESIYVAKDSEHKDAFFVGRPFSSDGLKVMAHYNMGDDQQIALANLTITNTTFSEAEAEHAINISYTENGVTKTTSYNVAVTYMNLNDLVAAADINDHDHVYVKFENVMITELVSKGILLNVQKGDKDIEIYNQSANCPNTWEQYGTVSATLDNVEWTNYQGTWEFKISNWDVVEYAAPNIPVTSMEISPAEVSVGETKTTTLSIVYIPEHATNTGVTWAVAEGSEEFASVNAEGVVTGLKAGTATITATLTADPTITATCTVTVTETPKCTISYYVKGEVASTQEIAREEEGTLTYEPTLTVAGYTFAGWAEAAIAEETATAALISTYTPAADEATKDVYAIFKRVDDSSPTYQKYAKVTSALTDWSGDYLIAYDDTHFANGKTGGEDGMGKQYASVSPSIALSGNVVTKEWGDQYKVTLEEISAGSNTYVLKTQDGKYNYQTTNKNGLTASSTKSTAAQYPITVTFTSENDIKLALGGNATGAVFRYNTDQYFRYYKDGGQKAIYLYKYDDGAALYTSNPAAKVKVTFNLDGGTGGCGTITVDEGEDVTLCEDAPTKDLYKFDAWSDGENEYAPGATIENVTEDIELKALWIAKQQYTISFSKGGAAGTTPDAITDYEYNVVTLPAQGDLSNPGYIFSGWNDGETTYAGGATFTMPENNVSMTAVWVAKTNDKWYLVTSADQLAAGKQYAIVSNEKEVAMGAMVSGKTYMANVSASFNADKSMMIAIDPSAVILTLGGNATDGWTLSNNNQFLGSETNKNMKWSATADDYCKWAITIADAEDDYAADIFMSETIGSLLYNSNNNSQRFTTYASDMTAVQLYVLVPAQAINEEENASTLDDHADVTVNEGGNLLIDASKTLGDIYVMEGGKVTISGSATLTVNNFVIKSTMAGGESGQVIGVKSTNFVVEGEAYYDVVLGDNANPEKWHAFAVPFNVDVINGIYDLDDNKLTNEVNYAIMDYHGDVRAQGQYGWKKFRGIMNPGVFYLMTVDGERTTYRMKMNGGFSASSSTITVNQYASGTGTDAGWNGIANNQLSYVSVEKPVQVLNPSNYTFEIKTKSSTNFTVGTPFFYQASGDGTITMAEANASEYYAPRRVGAAEVKNVDVTLANDRYTDHLYLSATDEATAEYQIGRDLVKMTMTNTPAVPQIFAEAYGNKLCMVDAPMMNDEATYALSLYAPANGEYTMSAEQVEDYELFLTKNGVVMWNLSMSDATIDLKKGNNAGYGIVMRKVAQVATDNEVIRQGVDTVQKFIYDDKLFIIRGGKTFDATGKFVK